MNLYIVCYRYTEEGARSPGSSRKRFPQLRDRVAGMGGELVGFYLTMGRYDTVAIVRFPKDEDVAAFALASTSLGYVTTETLRAFSAEDYLDIIAGLPGDDDAADAGADAPSKLGNGG